MSKKVIIIGAGASGLFCSFLLARSGCEVILLESGAKGGRKLAVSGGGHANFTNLQMGPDKFLCQPQMGFCEPVLAGFPPGKMLTFLEKWKFAWTEKEEGRLFLLDSAESFARKLENECRSAGVKAIYSQTVTEIDGSALTARTPGSLWRGDAIVLAQGSICGGAIAGNGAEISLASRLGHKRLPFSPVLVPMEFAGNWSEKAAFSSLAGISVHARVWLESGEKSWIGSLLFTHAGLSGPVILNSSLYWSRSSALRANFLPGRDFEAMLDAAPKKTPVSLLRQFVPDRLAAVLTESENLKNGNLSRRRRKLLAQRVCDFRFGDLRKSPMRLAEACSGGISTEKVNPATLESQLVPGVYFIGECLAVTGALGGYNLHWAWASAAAAARALGAKP